jgi:Zn-finger nucleic acid-binding protein
MNQYERNGVHVDQCVECGGLFLDRGELDHLVKAEAIYYGEATAPAPAPALASARPSDSRYDDSRSDDSRYDGRRREPVPSDPRYDAKYAKKRKRRSFFEELLDFD